MYNLLIADDEPLITDSLCDLFAGRGDREYNVLRAYSGREALGWMEKTRVDILLTDISMPDIDGLEVHRRVSAQWPECAVIYLTSFGEFEYAQQALRNNGSDYILKTEGDRAVTAAVEKAAALLDRKRSEKLLLERARDSLSLALPLLQDRFVSCLAQGLETAGDDLAAQLENLQMPLSADCPVLLLLGQTNSNGLDTTTERMRRIYRAKSAMEAYFTPMARQVCAACDRNKLVMLLQPLPPAGERLVADGSAELMRGLALRIGASLDDLQAVMAEVCGITLSFAAVSSPTAWPDIAAAFETLSRKLHEGLGRGERGLLYVHHGSRDGDSADDTTPRGIPQLSAKLGMLRSLLENGERESFFTLYDSIMASGSQMPFDQALQAELYYRMAALLVEYVNRLEPKAPEGSKPDVTRFVSFECHGSWDRAAAHFKELAESLFHRQRSESLKNDNRIYTFIREYTRKNIGGDLSLTRFAMLLNFHPFYLSRLFKRIAGKSLSDYVSEVKLARAKELLCCEQHKVSEIASELGFMTSSYFTSFFRKHTGMSPVEYRNSTAIAVAKPEMEITDRQGK